MKKFKGINYRQRPPSYWQRPQGLAGRLLNIKGAERRAMLADYWEQGHIAEIDKALLKPALTKVERQKLGQIHPAFMGGEYLPDYKPREVEIARIELQSATADVISIRARPGRDGIYFRVVDEYRAKFRTPYAHSREPLTLAEMIDFLDRSRHPELPHGLSIGFNELQAGICNDRQEWEHFAAITSDFYPQLGRHYECFFKQWAHAKKGDRR